MDGHYNGLILAVGQFPIPRLTRVDRLPTQKRFLYTPPIKPLEDLKEELSHEKEVLMNLRPRLAILSLLLLFTAFFVFRPLRATDERAAGRPLADSLLADNSARPWQAAQASQTADPQSSADETGPLFPVVEHGKCGYIDKTGKVVIPLQYYRAYAFHEGMAFVQMYPDAASPRRLELQPIDKTGKVIVGQEYSYAGPFAEGLALVEVPWSHGFFHIDKGGLGYIDKTGKMVIPLQPFGTASSFTEALAAVEVHGKWGYIDKTGKMVIPPQFSHAWGFSEGLAEVKDGGKWGYIDKNGKMVIPPQYDMAYKHSEGLAAVKTGGKWGFIDTTGQMVIPPQFSDTFGFSDGLVDVAVGKKWGYADKTGKMAIPPQFDKVYKYSEGLAAVKTSGKWGFIDKTGQMVIPLQYDEADPFSDGLANVEVDKKWGYIDKTGKYVWTPTK